MSEWDASRSLVTNVTYNFLSGVRDYTFFGWATAPSLAKNMKHAAYIFSTTIDDRNIQTPNLHSLAAGVMTAQLEGMMPGTGRLVNKNGIKGGVFKKKNGGEVGVLWSPNGKKTVLLECADAKPEVVSIFGQSHDVIQMNTKGKKYLQLEITKLPLYIHTAIPGLKLVSIISDIYSKRLPDILSPSLPPLKRYKVSYKITNYYDSKWNGTVKSEAGQGGKVAKRTIDFSLNPGDSTVIDNTFFIPRNSENTRFIWGMNCPCP